MSNPQSKKPAPAPEPSAGAAARRSFLRAGLAAGAIGALLGGRRALAAPEAAAAAPAPSTPPEAMAPELAKRNSILRMQKELERALRKPLAERRWVMVIDLAKCAGCHACTVACIAENRLPPGVVYRPVIEEELGTYPNVRRRFVPKPCMQCSNPPCVPVCPVGATAKRPDGIIDINYERCVGCRYCLTACPYSARVADFGERYTQGTPKEQPYEKAPAYEYGKKRVRSGGGSPVGNARKCHFCLHKLEVGMLPSCVSTCVGLATFMGDANDPSSLVAELIASPRVMRLKEEMGTNPNVFYLV